MIAHLIFKAYLPQMKAPRYNLLLADDDADDCFFFREALSELPFVSTLITVNDGVELMNRLTNQQHHLPDILFLDLNMPLKTGIECLMEIKRNERLKGLPVVICSTSYNPDVVNMLHASGANNYIRKPAEFSLLKKVIKVALKITEQENSLPPSIDSFVIHP